MVFDPNSSITLAQNSTSPFYVAINTFTVSLWYVLRNIARTSSWGLSLLLCGNRVHNITQLHKNDMWDLQYYAKYSPYFIWIWRNFHGMLSIPHNIDMDLNNIMLTLSLQTMPPCPHIIQVVLCSIAPSLFLDVQIFWNCYSYMQLMNDV